MEALARTTGAESLSPGRTRDRELVRFVGRHGLVAMRHVRTAQGVGRTAAYRRVAACVERGLLERLELLRSEAGLLRATRDGLRFAGLGLSVAAVSPGAVDHMLRCATVGQRAEARYGTDQVLTERELRLAEQIESRQIASAEIEGSYAWQQRFHRPDLAVFTDAGTIAIEVELTPKSPARLRQLIWSWKWTALQRKVVEVHYLCAPGQTRRAVERAIESATASSMASNVFVVDEAPAG